MFRFSFVLVALFVLGGLSFFDYASAANSPGSFDESQTVPNVLIERTEETFKVFASRVKRHDERALKMVSDEARAWLFASDPVQAAEQLALRFKMTDVTLGDITVSEDGAITAHVGFAGFYTRQGYYNLQLTFADIGEEYFLIDKVVIDPTRIPEGRTSTELILSFEAGLCTMSAKNIESTGCAATELDQEDFIVLQIDNRDAKPHVLILCEAGRQCDGLTVSEWIGQSAVAPNEKGYLTVANLEVGEYQLFDIVTQSQVMNISVVN